MQKQLKPCLKAPLLAVWLRQAAVRLVIALTGVLLLKRLQGPAGLPGLASLLAAGLFLLLVWVNGLRLSGVNLPRWKALRLPRRRDPLRGALADHLEEEPLLMEDLSREEGAACEVLSSGALALVFILLSLLGV